MYSLVAIYCGHGIVCKGNQISSKAFVDISIDELCVAGK